MPFHFPFMISARASSASLCSQMKYRTEAHLEICLCLGDSNVQILSCQAVVATAHTNIIPVLPLGHFGHPSEAATVTELVQSQIHISWSI
ncbi:hypothetical protein ABKN59_011676 [Abortiporus biennis]